MSLERLKAIFLQELFITRGSLEVIMDIFFFSIMTVIIFGFVTIFLSGAVSATAAHYLFLGMLLWEIVRITQYSISVGALWNIWSRNLSNMFITPLSLKEYMAAQMLSGVIKSLVVFIIIGLLATVLFNFNIFKLGFYNLVLFFVNLTLFSWSIGFFILAFIFRYGTRIQALAWGLVFLFQPLTAAFFPLSVLPSPLQTIALLLPPTFVFEAARAGLTDSAVNWHLTTWALLENIVYFVGSLWFFNVMFTKAKDTGQFARNEE